MLLFLATPLLFIAGMIRPSIINTRIKKELSRKQLALWLGVLFVGSFVGAGMSAEHVPTSETAEVQSSAEPTPAVEGTTTETAQESEDQTVPLVKVTRVIDGDTIELETGETVRYIGIDTPETKAPGQPIGCYGPEASRKNETLVLNKEVRLERDVSETDRYGRLLRYVYVPTDDGELLVNEVLVKEGFAQASSYPPDVAKQDIFRAAEAKAREKQLGLWSAECLPQTPNPTPTPTPTATPQPTATAIPTKQPAPMPATLAPTPVDTPTSSWSCNCSKTCTQMSSCQEAYYQLNTCGCSQRDGDGDGVPCESICR